MRRPGWAHWAMPAVPRLSACGRSWSARRGRGRARAGGLALGRPDRGGRALCAVEPELEESALLDYGPVRVLLRVTLAASLGRDRRGGAGGRRADRRRHDRHRPAPDPHLRRGGVLPVQPGPRAGRGRAGRTAPARRPGIADPDRRSMSWVDSTRRDWSRRLPSQGLATGPLADSLRRVAGRADRQRGRIAALQPGLASGQGRGPSHAGPRPPPGRSPGLTGTLRYAGAEIWEPLQASLVWTAIAATADGLPRLCTGLGQPPSIGLAMRGPGHAGPDARHARPGRRHGLGSGLS